MSCGVNGRDFFGRNPRKLAELLTLRQLEGWSYVRLGRHFSVDHTTVIYNLRRFAPHLLGRALTRKMPRQPQLRVVPVLEPVLPPPPKPADKYAHLWDEPINPGKSYAEYLRDAGHKKRRKTADL